MNKIDINLVSKKRTSGLREDRIRKVKLISFSLLMVIGTMSIVVFLVNLRLSINSIKTEQDNTIKSLSVYEKKAAKLFIVNTRLEDSGDIINHRGRYNEVAKGVLSQMPSSVNAKEVFLSKEGMTLRVTSQSLISLNDFINKAMALSKQKKFISNISIEKLTIEQEIGEYSLTLKSKII